MAKHSRDNRPYIKPVTKLELSEANIKLRWIAIAVLLAIAVVSIGYGFSQALSRSPGWQPVRSTSQNRNYSADFVLMYDFEGQDVNPTVQYKKLEAAYNTLVERAYTLFSLEAEGTDNLAYLNAHVNETVTVAPELYQVLEKLVQSGVRYPFMAPVQELYDPVYLSSSDAEAAVFDPAKNAEMEQLAKEMAFWCADPEAVSVKLLGENQAMLQASEEYLAFAETYGVETFLEFGWMTNAVVADFIADGLAAQGHTRGYLTSYDGFTRNLDGRENTFSVNFFDRQDNTILMPARLNYAGPASVVVLRDYPLSEEDRWHYRAYEDGSITHVYLDPADGQCKAATDSLMGFSHTKSCFEILLSLAPVFIGDSLDVQMLRSFEDIGSLWYEGTTLCYALEDASVQLLPESGGADYRIQ